MEIKYSEEMNYVLAEAHELAKTYHSQQIGLEHLMVCLLRYPGESVTQKIFNIFQIVACRNHPGIIRDFRFPFCITEYLPAGSTLPASIMARLRTGWCRIL